MAANWLTLGPKHATICARVHKNDYKTLAKILDLLFWFDPNHCRKAYVQWRYKIMEKHDG